MLEHGGRLIDASKKYNIPIEQWLDLSTGINPNGWSIPSIPSECWQRLPESTDSLIAAAKSYYKNDSILAVAGSQAAIQALPLLTQHSKVGVLQPAYAEHAYSWIKQGHEVIELSAETIDSQLALLDILILINPNNPTAQCFSKQQLLSWHQQLAQRGGCLIIDEAFIDSTPEQSLSSHPVTNGLIILRSVGKFFGLAGIRCGFIIAPEHLLLKLDELLGPWTISHPSRYIASQALLDIDWHKQTQLELKKQSARLSILLTDNALKPTGGCDLFQWIKTSQAKQIYQQLAQQGILTRLFNEPNSIRFGLPNDELQWNYLEKVLNSITI